MIVTDEVKARVVNVIKSCITIVEAKYNVQLRMPTITYNQRGTTAGTANYVTWVLNFNPVLLMENVEEFLKHTCPHELAHLACEKIYPDAHHPTTSRHALLSSRTKREVHGPRWQSIMNALSVDPSRCHTYDTSSVRKHSSYRYQCGCGKVLTCGQKIHAAIQINPASRYHCRGETLTWINGATTQSAKLPSPHRPPTGTKLDMCRDLYIQFRRTKSKAQMIQMFIDEAGCTPHGAQTYWYSVSKS